MISFNDLAIELNGRVGEEKGEAACFIMSMCPKKKPHLIGENDGIKNFTLRWNHVQVGNKKVSEVLTG